jgi:Fibronectin type III domain
MSTRTHKSIVVLASSCTLLFGIAAVKANRAAPATAAAAPVRLDEATMIVEVNATDRDAGLQVFLDGDAWRSMNISAPNGRRILAVDTKNRLEGYGLTELFSESSEPSFDEFPLRRFKRLFPEGKYGFEGTTIEGKRLVGSARLSHDFPAGPQITSPEEGGEVQGDNAVASWEPVPETSGLNIVGYRAIVEREDPLRVFSVELPASTTSVTIPTEYLDPGTEYKLEVQAIEASGNQTTTEVTFLVAP